MQTYHLFIGVYIYILTRKTPSQLRKYSYDCLLLRFETNPPPQNRRLKQKSCPISLPCINRKANRRVTFPVKRIRGCEIGQPRKLFHCLGRESLHSMSQKYNRCLTCCFSFFPFLNWNFVGCLSVLYHQYAPFKHSALVQCTTFTTNRSGHQL